MLKVVQSKRNCRQAPRRDSDQQRPGAPDPGGPQHQHRRDDQRHYRHARTRCQSRAFGDVFHPIEGDGQDHGRDQHEHRAGDDGRNDASQPGQPGRQCQVKERAQDDEAGQQGRPSFLHGQDRNGDEVGSDRGNEQVAPAQPPDAGSLQGGGRSGDDQGREDGPRHELFVLAGRQDGNGHDQHGRRQHKGDALGRDPQGHHRGTRLVRFALDVLV